jgi:lysophospholipase L1-like esterase
VLRSIGFWLLLPGLLAACAAAPSPAPRTVPPTTAPPTTTLPTTAPTPRPTPTLGGSPVPPLLIVTLGDSLTSGDKDDEPGGWPRRLLPLVQPARPQAQLVNLAQPGWTSRDLLQGVGEAPSQIDQAVKLLREARGDKIATVWIGVNDLFYLYEFGDPTPAEEAQDARRFGRDLGELLKRLHGTGARVFMALLHDPAQGPVQTSGVFLSTAAEEWARMSQQAQRYNDIIKIAAAQYHAKLVDIPATQIFTTPALMVEDGIHPNARGYAELARVWWNALSDQVTR